MPQQIPHISPRQLECGTRTAKIHSVGMPHHPFFFGGPFAKIRHLQCLQSMNTVLSVVRLSDCFSGKKDKAKRRTQNAYSGTRVPNAGRVYSGFWLQKPPKPFFAPCKTDPLCHIEFFHLFSSWTSVSSTTIKFVRGQNLFLLEKKRIQEGNLTCPTNLVRPEPF